MSHCGGEKVGGRCEQMRLHTQTWEEAVSYWSFKGATVSLLSRHVERNENAYECSSRRDSVPITRWVSPGFAAPPLFPISFLFQPTSGFIHMYQKREMTTEDGLKDNAREWTPEGWLLKEKAWKERKNGGNRMENYGDCGISQHFSYFPLWLFTWIAMS